MAMPLWSNGIREMFSKLGLAMLNSWFNDFTTYMTSVFNSDNTIKPQSLTDANAPNNSVYYSTTTNKLTFKDSAGVTHLLY